MAVVAFMAGVPAKLDALPKAALIQDSLMESAKCRTQKCRTAHTYPTRSSPVPPGPEAPLEEKNFKSGRIDREFYWLLLGSEPADTRC